MVIAVYNAASRTIRRALRLKTDAGHAFTERPELIGQNRVDCPWAHAGEGLVIGRHLFGDIAIFAIDAALPVELGVCRAPDAGGRALARGLETLVDFAVGIDPTHGPLFFL